MTSTSETRTPIRLRALPAGWQYRFPPRYRVIWIATIVLVAVTAIVDSHTFAPASLRIETPLVGVLAIASLGQLIVVIVGGFDLSVSGIMTFACALMLKISGGASDKLIVAVVLTLLACACIGLVSGILTSAGLNPMIVTLAVGGVATAVTLLITNGGVGVFVAGAPKNLITFSGGYVDNVSNLLFVAIGVLLVGGLVLRGTTAGRRLIATGDNPRSARVVGVHVRAYAIGAYVVAAVLYGGAAILLSGFIGNPDLSLGDPYLLSTFIVVALGGALIGGGPSSVFGTALGAVFLTLLDQFLSIRGLSPGDQSVIQGVVLIVSVAAVTALRGRSRLSLRSVVDRRRNRGAGQTIRVS